MSTSYSFTISGSFTNATNVNLTDLHTEIKNNVTITTAIEKINRTGDDVLIWFVSSISGGESTELNSVIDAYTHSAPIDDTAPNNCYMYSTGALNILDETAAFDVPMNTEVKLDSGYSHVADSAEIKILTAGSYRIEYKVSAQSINNTSKGKFWMEVKPNAGSYSIINSSEGFITSTDPEQTTVSSGVLYTAAANDTLKLRIQGIGTDDDFILIANDSSVLITKV